VVDGEAERGADLVHAGVAFADGLLGVVVGGVFAAELHVEFERDFGQAVFVDEWEDARLDRRELRLELHHATGRV
jgi:hypothetical protein